MVATALIEQELRERIDDEIASRIAAHQARVAPLRAARRAAANLGVAVVDRPKLLLALGDSWFDYPLTGNGLPLADTDVIAQLRLLGDSPPLILNLAHHGEASTDALALPQQRRLVAALTDPDNWLDTGRPDAILISAGGNDIVGNQFCIFLDFNDGVSTGLNQTRFQAALGMVEASYLDLFALRDRIAPGVPIIGHGYDFPIPNGVHPICAGPWLRPSLDYSNWSVAQGQGIAAQALTTFRTLLTTLAADPAHNFQLVETQGTLQPTDWANELHPTPAGFLKIARLFAARLGVGA